MIKRLSPRLAAPLFCAAATLLVFLPSLGLPLLNWDDAANLTNNPHWQGLTPSHLRWMFTTHFRGPYQPLSWLSYALDRAVWGADPLGYHLTNVLLHAANAALACAAALLLLEKAFEGAPPLPSLAAPAAFAALAFSLHPLRVESVSWVTERRDVLSGLFFLLALLAYLREIPRRHPPRLRLTLVFFTLALLSKATAVGLLWTLLAVDVYPLRRLPADPRRWNRPSARAALLEKWPFALAALLLGALNLRGFSTGDLQAGHYSALARLAVYAHGLGFYLVKTALPAGLSPYYYLPVHLRALAPRLLAGAAVFAAALGAALLTRRVAAAAALLCYALILAPVGGLLQNGQQLAADRYSYLSCLPLALLAAAGLALLAARGRRLAAGLGAAMLLSLSALTARQQSFWSGDAALWTRAVTVDPDDYLAQSNLATTLFTSGDDLGARAHYLQALRLKPSDAQALLNLGALEERHGDYTGALERYRAALAVDPGLLEAQNNAAVVLIKRGDWKAAAALLESVAARNPDLAQARFNLGMLLSLHGRRQDGLPHLRRALALDPSLKGRLPPGKFPELAH